MALLRRLAAARGGNGSNVGDSGGGSVGGGSSASAVTPEPISRAELRAARRRLLAGLEHGASLSQVPSPASRSESYPPNP